MVQHMSKFQNRKITFRQERPCYAEVNGPEIKQVVLNLVANALESMNEKGTLKISLCEEMDQVLLVFQDDGCGMSSDTIENLFEPFYTQRETAKARGWACLSASESSAITAVRSKPKAKARAKAARFWCISPDGSPKNCPSPRDAWAIFWGRQ